MDFKKVRHDVGVLLFGIDWLKTVFFNLKYFPLRQAVMMPFFIYRHSCIRVAEGEIRLMCPVRPGLVKFGTKGLGTVDIRFARAIWEVSGTLVVHGKVGLGLGTKISIGCGATLELGGDFVVTGNSAIVCQRGIRFGDGRGGGKRRFPEVTSLPLLRHSKLVRLFIALQDMSITRGSGSSRAAAPLRVIIVPCVCG